MPTDPLSTLALATGGAFLGKFVGPAAESLGKLAWERAQQLGQQAHQLLAAVGREPQSVEPKLLIPLVQAAALESDETLAAKWAALLANAADSAQQVTVQPAFAEALRQLTTDDALVLSHLYSVRSKGKESASIGFFTVKDVINHFTWPSENVELCLDNLLRLRLFETSNAVGGPLASSLHPPSIILTTAFGRGFLLACTPPTAQPR